MLHSQVSAAGSLPFAEYESPPPALHELAVPGIANLVAGLPLQRRRVRARQYVFRAGECRQSLFLIHAGCFKTSVISQDGREKITGFRLRGDLLGMDALDMPRYACNAISLDVGEVWELPVAELRDSLPGFQQWLTAALASEIRRDWGWMLAIGTLAAEQRVITFLLDLASRLEALGFSARCLTLRMTRADLGNFLALQLETVTRALSHLQALGVITVERRQIRIEDASALRAMLGATRTQHQPARTVPVPRLRRTAAASCSRR